ncbi:hypothetical protein M0657_007564 [Pyricularia oryzae]|uniref:Uncharacterized protein n=2 Tax=Pyricularia oryzae TaxID=318829 RepID=Q2KFG9_PYRO7|nr:hypothetical protein MGCH7_ch7g717 [Pyricularia oryzae 70-15]KAI7911272.1 hypothetical protein M9X92_010606 [Pyricularia oryzae]KAI7918443.1 hypothetical protein M0657_007564 [Pyricularia oryzae]QBZ65766.1 hypothetical protein PoMZ_12729 [Pyricularia oryzae]
MGEVSVLKTRNTNKSVPEKSRVQFRKEQVEDEDRSVVGHIICWASPVEKFLKSYDGEGRVRPHRQ